MEHRAENKVFAKESEFSQLFFFSKITIVFQEERKTCQTAGVLIIMSAVGICSAYADVTGRQQRRSEAEKVKPEKEQRSLTKITSVSFARGCHCFKVLRGTRGFPHKEIAESKPGYQWTQTKG